MSELPENVRQVKAQKAPKGLMRYLDIPVVGHRDPRGPDNNIQVWVDEKDRLHIRVQKTNRCYQYEETIETNGYVEVVAS